jgi:hypothetical protein
LDHLAHFYREMQTIILFTFEYSRPLHSFPSIVYDPYPQSRLRLFFHSASSFLRMSCRNMNGWRVNGPSFTHPANTGLFLCLVAHKNGYKSRKKVSHRSPPHRRRTRPPLPTTVPPASRFLTALSGPLSRQTPPKNHSAHSGLQDSPDRLARSRVALGRGGQRRS